MDDFLIKTRPTRNPYLTSLKIIFDRFCWDVNSESWISRKKLKALKNLHEGEKAVILCNGPSLLKSDISLLKNTFTFGLNKINLLFDKSDFRPSCIVSVNPHVLNQNKDFFNKTDIQLFLDSKCKRFINSRKNTMFLHSNIVPGFARDCSISIFQGYTVTYVALELAFHMGFKEIALIGCDHNFATQGIANKEVISGHTDPNHFDPNYFSGGVKWHLPDLLNSEVYYSLARDVYEQAGRKIYNATDGGKLEIYERISLIDFLRK